MYKIFNVETRKVIEETETLGAALDGAGTMAAHACVTATDATYVVLCPPGPLGSGEVFKVTVAITKEYDDWIQP